MSDKMGFYDKLFKFCVENSNEDNRTTDTRNSSDRKWLREALNDLVASPIEIVKACVQALEANATTSEEEDIRLQAIVTLNEWIEDIDISRDFLKLQKYELIENLLKDESGPIRLEACRLISCISQNFEDAQNILCNDTDVVKILMNIVQTDLSIDHQSKALTSLRCLVDNNKSQLDKFLNMTPVSGYDILAFALQSNEHGMQLKVAIFIRTLIENDKISDLINRDFAVLIKNAYAKKPWNQSKHLLLSCIFDMMKASPSAFNSCIKICDDMKSIIANIPSDEDKSADIELRDEILSFIEDNQSSSN